MGGSDDIPGDWREWRRLRAFHLKQRGWYQRDIAEALGVREEAVSRWLARARDRGPQAPDPGIPLARGGGLRLPRGGVDDRPHRPSHCGGIWRPLPQGPRRQVAQRTALDSPGADQTSHPAGRGSHPPLAGGGLAGPTAAGAARAPGAGFRGRVGLLPAAGGGADVRPQARTPVIREMQTRDHLSVMGGMTPEGKVYTLVRQESLNGLDSIEFLLHLGRVAGSRLLVIWDGSPIHRRAEVQAFVADTRGAVCLEALPGYAPDLNPWDEG